jgi:CzcA family heavy metal efflux pump
LNTGLGAWMRHHCRSLFFLLLLLVIGGIYSAWKLPVALFPQIDFPRVALTFNSGDRPAERMEMEVTQPVESAVRGVPGVRRVRSTTSRGCTEFSVDFDWGMDMVSALLQVESAINQVLPTLPAGTTFDARRMDTTVFPVLGYSLTSDSLSPVALRDLAAYRLSPLLSTVSGVAKIDVQGGGVEEIHIVTDSARLAAYGVTVADLSHALAASSEISAVGHLEDHNKLYLILSGASLDDLSKIRDIAIRVAENGVVRVGDVADVTPGVAPDYSRVTADGRDAVLLSIYQQPGGNTVEIAGQLKQKLEAYRSRLPPGVHIANWYDQSDLILQSAGSVRDAVLIGAALSACVLLLFLRSWKITLISALCVPAVLAATVLLIYACGQSFNMMTLGGMAAAVGLIIDDAIGMVEHLVRRLRHRGPERARRAAGPLSKILAAAEEFTPPLTASSLSTIVIFAPLAFLSGVTGAFFKALSFTMAISLGLSYLVTLLVVPIMADVLLGEKEARHEDAGRVTRALHHGYERFMHRCFARPWLVVASLVPLFFIGWIAYQRLGTGFMPQMDEGGFVLDYVSDPGTSLAETDRLLRQVEAILRDTPEVATYSRRTGQQLGGGLTETNQGDFFVKLKPGPRRPIDEVIDDVRDRINKRVSGLDIEFAQLMEDLIGDLTSVPEPIEIQLYGDDVAMLSKTADSVADALGNIKGVVDVESGLVVAGDALNVDIDPLKAAIQGTDPAAITDQLSDLWSGAVDARVLRGVKTVDIRVSLGNEARRRVEDLENTPIRAPDGHIFLLRQVASVSVLTGQPEITRQDLRRMISVTGRLSGRDLGSTVRDIRAALQKPGLLPPQVTFVLGGAFAEQQAAFAGLLVVLGAAVALIFLLLLYVYENFQVAAAILFTTVLALPIVFLGLWLTHTELNITSMMGLTMVVGIATEVSIFLVSEISELPPGVHGVPALILAAKNRMRPILMTTVAAVLALLPLALGIGRGSAMQQPLAIAIICGLVGHLPLVLIVLPVLLPRPEARSSSVS